MSQHLDFQTTSNQLRVWCHDHRRWCRVIAYFGGPLVCECCQVAVDHRLSPALRSTYR